MNKRGMGIFGIIFLMVALAVGAAIVQGDITIEQTETLKDSFANNISDINVSLPNYPELQNAINYYANGLVKSMIELMKWTIDYSAHHPEIPYKLLLYGVLLAIISPLIIVFFKLLVIIFLLFKEHFQSKKEKKLINSYKGGKANENENE